METIKLKTTKILENHHLNLTRARENFECAFKTLSSEFNTKIISQILVRKKVYYKACSLSHIPYNGRLKRESCGAHILF